MPIKIYYSLLWVFVARIFCVVYNRTDKYSKISIITNILSQMYYIAKEHIYVTKNIRVIIIGYGN